MDRSKRQGNWIRHGGTPAAALLAITVVAAPAWSDEAKMIPLRQGYLFVDGKYVQPPYEITVSDDSIIINGQSLAREYFDLSDYERERATRARAAGRGWMMQRGRRPGGMRLGGMRMDDQPEFSSLHRLKNDLSQTQLGATAVLFANEKPMLLYPSRGGHELLTALVDPGGAKVSAPDWITLEGNQVAWDRMMREFQTSDVFLARAKKDIDQIEQVDEAARRVTGANQWVSTVSYPLTVFAMVVVVLGFGHLLSNRPAIAGESNDWGKQHQVVVKSLVIVALLSAVDLVWTIAATGAGSTREMNPLGNRLIEDPAQLVLFKVTVTGMAIGILYALHRKPVAQIASWWACLLLTLLTARWVVFQSMFL